ncbi:MAG: hypothetical protein ACT4PM_05130 [Gemmatimonadales bacterium]
MILGIVLLGSAVLIVFAEGRGINAFTLWNLVPVTLIAIVWLLGSKRSSTSIPLPRKGALLGFAILTHGFTLSLHLAWAFDIGDVQTGSSTAGLIFLFIPPFALASGLAGALVGWLIGKRLQRRSAHPIAP